MKIIKGDLLKLAKDGEFDVIAHGCNCFLNFGAGIAKSIKEQFPSAYERDLATGEGDYSKMGNFTVANIKLPNAKELIIINCYTQYWPGKASPGCTIPLDYSALAICLRKINYYLPKKSIGLPWIGCGLALGNREMVRKIIDKELFSLDVTLVEFGA